PKAPKRSRTAMSDAAIAIIPKSDGTSNRASTRVLIRARPRSTNLKPTIHAAPRAILLRTSFMQEAVSTRACSQTKRWQLGSKRDLRWRPDGETELAAPDVAKNEWEGRVRCRHRYATSNPRSDAFHVFAEYRDSRETLRTPPAEFSCA